MRGSKPSTYGFRLFAATVVVATLGAWIFLFRIYEENFGSALSGNQATWGAFGQYVGGLLTPLLGTFTLVGVLYIAHLQREVVAQARRSQRGQRRHYRRRNFERVFFRMLDTIDAHFAQTSIKFRTGELQQPVTGAGVRSQQLEEDGEDEIKGPKAFAQFIKIFGARALLPVRRGDFPGRDQNVVLRAKARELIAEYDHVVGPPLRLMCDLLVFLDDFEARYCRPNGDGTRPTEGKLQRPQFYARVAMNARTRYEMKVFAMYTGSDLASAEVVRIARAYGVFETIEPKWWGREAFLND
jgi:hypothetical protein